MSSPLSLAIFRAFMSNIGQSQNFVCVFLSVNGDTNEVWCEPHTIISKLEIQHMAGVFVYRDV